MLFYVLIISQIQASCIKNLTAHRNQYRRRFFTYHYSFYSLLKRTLKYPPDVQTLFAGMDDTHERLARTIGQLHELGFNAEVDLTGDISVELIGPQPVHLPLSEMEKLIEESLNEAQPTIKSAVASALTKNYLLRLSGTSGKSE